MAMRTWAYANYAGMMARSTVKAAPLPRPSLSACTDPPCNYTMLFTMCIKDQDSVTLLTIE